MHGAKNLRRKSCATRQRGCHARTAWRTSVPLSFLFFSPNTHHSIHLCHPELILSRPLPHSLVPTTNLTDALFVDSSCTPTSEPHLQCPVDTVTSFPHIPTSLRDSVSAGSHSQLRTLPTSRTPRRAWGPMARAGALCTNDSGPFLCTLDEIKNILM
jgi:hypothetical protein